MAQLQKIVASMDSSEVSLSSSILSYQEGVKLIAECQNALSQVANVIEQVNPDGEIESLSFEQDQAAD